VSAIVLLYHSHNISGSSYAENDHVALAADLRVIGAAGGHIVPLTAIVQAVRSDSLERDELLVGLSFDDGPRFDFEDFEHPRFGLQRGFAGILRDFQRETGTSQPHLHATSFVIASPDARHAMEAAPECGLPDLAGWLGDDWWGAAIDSGLMDIGNHSWDHVHQAAGRIAASTVHRNDFRYVDNYADADREIRAASTFIGARTGRACRLFAFPFGHSNEYLVGDYLPGRTSEHGLVGAFGTAGRAIRPDDTPWNLPRFACGEHWRTPEEFRSILGR
jgi:hypothetical protein